MLQNTYTQNFLQLDYFKKKIIKMASILILDNVLYHCFGVLEQF